MDNTDCIKQLQNFRQAIYESIPVGRDSIMNTLDALCGNHNARSVVELTLNPLFQRQYSSLFKALAAFISKQEKKEAEEGKETEVRSHRFPREWTEAIGNTLQPPQEQEFWCFGADTTPVPRCYGDKLKDREYVYQPTPVPSQRPLAVGHCFSLVTALPEKSEELGSTWSVPVSMERVTSFESKTAVAQRQIENLLDNENLPWHAQKCVIVCDGGYSDTRWFHHWLLWENLVVIARCRSNRVFYRQPQAEEQRRRGRPRWYGERFDLKDASTWGEAEQSDTLELTTAKGKVLYVKLQRWCNLLMRGKQECPMHKYPFDLLRVEVKDANGEEVYRRPLWLIVFGKQRQHLDAKASYEFYQKRPGLEHTLRFGKRHLLMDALQTPEVKREELWVQLSCLAYAQLWACRHLAQWLPVPWQKYLPTVKERRINPSMVQRDFVRIISEIGTPAEKIKPRGKSKGRSQGEILTPRPRRPLVKRRLRRPKKRQNTS